ncbi:hypothetical protein B296_00058072 [Ensete ventricosum]|uniref:Uncharacterized protein n=1 Tax=Ensete ventricosum TaxID=4639 RepID=A0A426XG50_ENSVE|nr:hypothetical protein B296_00058072 [Ensete ventricosum]
MKTRASQKWSPSFFGPYKIGDHTGAITCVSDLYTNSELQLILSESHYKWKIREDDSAQVHPLDISTNEEAQHGAPSIGATRKPHEELKIKTRSHGVLALRTRLI